MDSKVPATAQEQQSAVASSSASGTKDSSRVVHALVNELVKLGFLCWLIAWALSSMLAAYSLCSYALLTLRSSISWQPSCCTGTSKSFWINLPLAGLLIASGQWLLNQVHEITKQQSKPKHAKQSTPAEPFAFPVAPPSGSKPEGKWKEQVNSPIVVQAWEALSGSIVQEVCWSCTAPECLQCDLPAFVPSDICHAF